MLVHAGIYRTEDELKIMQTIHKLKTNQQNITKYIKTRLPWFSRLLRQSARKQGGLILQHSQSHTDMLIIQSIHTHQGVYTDKEGHKVTQG